MIVLRLVAKSPKPEVTVSVKVIKRGGKVIDMGKICYDGPWYKKLWFKVLRLVKRRV